jgi:uncharacterized metal-binding protein
MMNKNNKIALVACSGAANTGQTANEVVADLCAKSKDYTMVCLAALTLGHKNSLDKIANAKKIIVIDGCPVRCASQIVSKFTNKKPDLDIQIMEEYGIKKVSEPKFEKEDVDRITRDIEKKTKAL